MIPAVAAMGARFAAAMGQATPALQAMTGTAKKLGGDALLKPLQAFGDVTAGAGKMFSEKLIGSLKPVALFSQAMQASTSGQGVFQRSLNVLGSLLGTLLTPAFVFLAAGVMTAASWLSEKLAPQMEGYYKIAAELVEKALPALTVVAEKLGSMFMWCFTQVQHFGRGLIVILDKINGSSGTPSPKMSDLGMSTIRRNADGSAALKDPQNLSSPAPSDLSSPSGSRFGDAMRKVLDSLGKENSPKSQTTDLVGAYRASMSAVMNTDQIAMEQLKIQQDMLKGILALVAKPTPAPGVRVT